jgi:hypothetical protein
VALPPCLAKLCWATKVDPEKRFEKLIDFSGANGLDAERKFLQKSLAALRAK